MCIEAWWDLWGECVTLFDARWNLERNSYNNLIKRFYVDSRVCNVEDGEELVQLTVYEVGSVN
jgi:hypothetical protein